MMVKIDNLEINFLNFYKGMLTLKMFLLLKRKQQEKGKANLINL